MSGQGLYVEERRTQLQQAVQQMHTMAQAEGCDVIYGGTMIALRLVGGGDWLRHGGDANIAL